MFTALVYVYKNYPGIKWEQFTHADADGKVNNKIYEIMFLHSGFPAEHGNDPLDRMWSHQNAFSATACKNISIFPNGTVQPHNQNWDARDGSTQAKDFLTRNITRSDNALPIKIVGYLITNGCFANRFATCYRPRLGVIVHEIGHSSLHGTKIRDYYESVQSVSYSNRWPSYCSSTGSIGAGIGTYGIMGDSWGVCADQYVSQSLECFGGDLEGGGSEGGLCCGYCAGNLEGGVARGGLLRLLRSAVARAMLMLHALPCFGCPTSNSEALLEMIPNAVDRAHPPIPNPGLSAHLSVSQVLGPPLFGVVKDSTGLDQADRCARGRYGGQVRAIPFRAMPRRGPGHPQLPAHREDPGQPKRLQGVPLARAEGCGRR